MDTLRIILIIFGVMLVAGIYLVDRLRQRKAREVQRTIAEVPLADELGNFQVDENDIPPEAWLGMTFKAQRHATINEDELRGIKVHGDDENISEPNTQATAPSTESEAKSEEQSQVNDNSSVIILTLIAQKGKRIRGPVMLRALKDAGLFFGDMDIFHYVEKEGEEPLFSVASILEPGRFVLSELAEFETPGIAMFMSLPTSLPGGEALHIMLSKARQLGAQLNATLCDGQRQPLSDEMLAWLEKKAKEVD
jgi:cell division protein ZipA